MIKRVLLMASAVVVLPCAGFAQEPPQRPAAPPAVPVTETYFGTTITDPYRYMESKGDLVFEPWIRAEGRYTRSLFDRVTERVALEQRISRFTGGFTLAHSLEIQAGRKFWLERQPGSDNFDLMLEDAGGRRKLIDVGAERKAKGGTPMAINYFSVSPDGSRVAVGSSEGGSERVQLSVYDPATGRRIAGPLDRMQFGGISWSADSKILYGNQLAPEDPKNPAARYVNSAAVAWDMNGVPVPLIGAQVAGATIPVRPEQFSLVTEPSGATHRVALVINGVQNEQELWATPVGGSVLASTPWKRVSRARMG